MKIVLDLTTNGQLKENDIIVCKNGKWTVISRESFLANHINENRQAFIDIENNEKLLDEKIDNVDNKLSEQIKKLQKDLISLAKIVKEK